MTAKSLIEHTRNLLVQHNLTHQGIHHQDVKDTLFKMADKSKINLALPIVVPEEEMVARYMQENKITGQNECIFLTETFLGCVRHRKIIEVTLKLFYEKSGGRYLQNEYYLFAVFCYLALWRLDELGFAKFSRFVQCFDPAKMSRFIGFIFNVHNIETELKQLWGNILDQQYLKTHVVDPLTRNLSTAQKLLEDLCNQTDYGMIAKKSEKKPTQVEPFLLTKPRCRKLPEPTIKISSVIKAIPVPKTLYSESIEKIRLEKAKVENRKRVEQLLHAAKTDQFKAAQTSAIDRKKQIRDEIEREQREQYEKERIKPQRPIPQSIHQHVPVKLTTAAILREDALVRKIKREATCAAEQAEVMLRDPAVFEARKEAQRIKEEQERVLELERRRLEVQMAHEDAFVARQDKIKENREKAVQLLADKEEFRTISDELKKEHVEENKRKIENVQEIKEGVVKAKAKVLEDKSRIVAQAIQESQQLLEIAQREAQEEFARKTELIQQIRLLEKSVPPVGTFQKEIDLTETSGIGLLGEMSIMELQERLILAKVRYTEIQQERRTQITEHKAKRQDQMQQKLADIDSERQERKQRRTKKTQSTYAIADQLLRSEHGLDKALKDVDCDPRLRILQAKVYEKKAARLAATHMGMQGSTIRSGGATPASVQIRRYSSLHSTRPGTAVSERWDELDEAERVYMMRRRQQYEQSAGGIKIFN